MATYNLALIGFGGVNRALAELVSRKNAALEKEVGLRLNIVAVSDLHYGSVVSPNGIDPRALTETRFSKGGFASLSGGRSDADNERVIKEAPADIVVEATFTDRVNGEPAITHCRWAIEAGRHVVTTNKGPVAFAARELKLLAAAHGVGLEYEGSVMSGTPVIRFAKRTLLGSGLNGFEGILNGTSNFILGKMEAGLTFDAALREAQELGLAEADPTADVEGHDVRLKVVILANELLGAEFSPRDVVCKGISHLTPAALSVAAGEGKRWKLIGSAKRDERGKIHASVEPRSIPLVHPLAGVNGATNAISFQTELLGSVTVTGPGAGRTETAYALISDIIAIHQANIGATKPCKEAA
jgi:homoserine dehydrogenase